MALFHLIIIESTKKMFEDALREIQQEENVGLSFSACSYNRIREYLARLKVGYEVGDTLVLPTTGLAFESFE